MIYLLSAVLIYSLLSNKIGIVKKFLNLNFFIWSGTLSYSVYMSHLSVLWVMNQFLRIILKKPEILDKNGTSIPQLTILETIIFCSISLILIYTLSLFAYKFVEKPIREKSRKFNMTNIEK